MKITIQDEDLQELITTGTNSGKYKKLTRDKKFIERLANVYRIMTSVEKTSDLVHIVICITRN
jgi:hypothetical protein